MRYSICVAGAMFAAHKSMSLQSYLKVDSSNGLSKILTCVLLFLTLFDHNCFAVSLKDAKISNANKIVVYIGTFDPIHNGHVGLIEAAQKQLNADFVFVIPNPVPPHKILTATSYQERLAMVRALFLKSSTVIVPDENNTQSMSHLIDYVHDNSAAQLVGLVGDDIVIDPFREFFYKLYRGVFGLPGQVVAIRGGMSDHDRQLISEKGYEIVDFGQPKEISSSLIRKNQRLDLVPPEIASYIKNNNLYGITNCSKVLSKEF